ncbi:MAG: hypothetical protein QOH25_3840 [Acidobacteriota bacterium]|jgi:hypothetical protein|nr:hypothetical protein [Acidobacteriota bacterium]
MNRIIKIKKRRLEEKVECFLFHPVHPVNPVYFFRDLI